MQRRSSTAVASTKGMIARRPSSLNMLGPVPAAGPWGVAGLTRSPPFLAPHRHHIRVGCVAGSSRLAACSGSINVGRGGLRRIGCWDAAFRAWMTHKCSS